MSRVLLGKSAAAPAAVVSAEEAFQKGGKEIVPGLFGNNPASKGASLMRLVQVQRNAARLAATGAVWSQSLNPSWSLVVNVLLTPFRARSCVTGTSPVPRGISAAVPAVATHAVETFREGGVVSVHAFWWACALSPA